MKATGRTHRGGLSWDNHKVDCYNIIIIINDEVDCQDHWTTSLVCPPPAALSRHLCWWILSSLKSLNPLQDFHGCMFSLWTSTRCSPGTEIKSTPWSTCSPLPGSLYSCQVLSSLEICSQLVLPCQTQARFRKSLYWLNIWRAQASGENAISGDVRREAFMEEGELAGQAFEVQVTAKVMSLKKLRFDPAHVSVGLTNPSCWSKSHYANVISVRQRPLLSGTILPSCLPPPRLPDHRWHRLGIQVQQDPRKEKMRSFSRSDIRELAEHFGQFGSEQMIGIGNDLTPHYWARCPIIYIWSSLIIAILVVGLFRLKSLLVLMLLFKKILYWYQINCWSHGATNHNRDNTQHGRLPQEKSHISSWDSWSFPGREDQNINHWWYRAHFDLRIMSDYSSRLVQWWKPLLTW